VRDLVLLAPLGRGNVFLSLLPLSHMFEQTVGFFIPVTEGAGVVYLDSLKPSSILRAFEEERVTLAVMVPRLLKGLQQGIQREVEGGLKGAWFRGAWAAAGPLPTGARRLLFAPVHRKFGGRVRFFFSGGAPLEADTEAFWERMGFPILQGWGLTETSPVAACARPDARRAGTVGKFLATVEHRLTPEGEIHVRGPSVFSGYLDDPVRTKEVLSDGWFNTGDLGEIRDGFLTLKGRSKDLIKSPGGLNVYPEDVEAALRAVDGVRDACVFGMKGDKGEEVAAALVPWPGRSLDPRAVVAAANANLEEGRGVARAFVWPEEDFPRTPTLKVRKFQVKEAVEKGTLAEGKVEGRGPEDPVLALIEKLARRPAAEVKDGHRLGPDLGLDSLDIVDLVSSLEERLHLDIDEGDVAPETTVGALREMVLARKPVDGGGLASWPRTWWGLTLRWGFQYLLMFPLFRIFVRVEAKGLENLEGLEGPVIFAPNHLSHLDTPGILWALPYARRRRTGAAAWKEYWEPPGAPLPKRAFLEFLRLLLTVGLPMVPMAQTRAYRKSLRGVGTMLDAGWSLIFFPEGERSRSGQLLPFRQGIGIVAGGMRAQIVPVKVGGFGSILPRDGFWPRRGTGTVVFGKPLSFPPDTDPARIAKAVEAAVDAL
jgi:long-chain acyl-CoA synthetase